MNEKQAKYVDALCGIYHRIDSDHQIDHAAFTLLLSLVGFAPLGNIPRSVRDSLKAFRPLSHQERYVFSMAAISSLLASPCKNQELRDMFNQVIKIVDPLTDGVGVTVVENGYLNFGPFDGTQLESLIFYE